MWRHYDIIMESRASIKSLNYIVWSNTYWLLPKSSLYLVWLLRYSRPKQAHFLFSIYLSIYLYILSRTPFYQFHKEHPKNTKFWLSITQKPFIEFIWNFYSLLIYHKWSYNKNFIQFSWWEHGLIFALNSAFCSESTKTYIGTGTIFFGFFSDFFSFFTAPGACQRLDIYFWAVIEIIPSFISATYFIETGCAYSYSNSYLCLVQRM